MMLITCCCYEIWFFITGRLLQFHTGKHGTPNPWVFIQQKKLRALFDCAARNGDRSFDHKLLTTGLIVADKSIPQRNLQQSAILLQDC